MRKTIHIHIGAHRTGTSAVQSHFTVHRGALATGGYLYPRSCGYRFAQHRLAMALTGRRDKFRDDVPDLDIEAAALDAEIAAAPQRQVIISSESFFSLPAAGIGRLAAKLDHHDVRVVAVIRRPDELFQSICGNRIKRTAMQFDLDLERMVADPARLSRDMSFARGLDNWRGVFGREAMCVGCYEASRDSVALVAGLIGIPPGVLTEPVARRNDSLSARATRIVLEGKRAGLPAKQLNRLLKAAEARHPLGAERASLLSPAERMNILEACAAGTQAVFETYLGGENLYHPSRFSEADFPPRAELTQEDLALLAAV